MTETKVFWRPTPALCPCSLLLPPSSESNDFPFIWNSLLWKCPVGEVSEFLLNVWDKSFSLAPVRSVEADEPLIMLLVFPPTKCTVFQWLKVTVVGILWSPISNRICSLSTRSPFSPMTFLTHLSWQATRAEWWATKKHTRMVSALSPLKEVICTHEKI